MINIKDLAWQDTDSGSYNQIIELNQFNGEDLVWYRDTKTFERHCMSVDMFVTKHKACGIFRSKKHA